MAGSDEDARTLNLETGGPGNHRRIEESLHGSAAKVFGNPLVKT